MESLIKLIECPRDAMQGWERHIPTAEKAAYLNALLRVGFDVLDFGSFVSAKAIPQLADTKDVIPQLDLTYSREMLDNKHDANVVVGGGSFTVDGLSQSRDQLALSLDLTAQLTASGVGSDRLADLVGQDIRRLILHVQVARKLQRAVPLRPVDEDGDGREYIPQR